MYNYQKNLIVWSQNIFTSSSVVREKASDLATFVIFVSSVSLEYNFSLADLKYSLKFLATKSFTSLSLKIFT